MALGVCAYTFGMERWIGAGGRTFEVFQTVWKADCAGFGMRNVLAVPEFSEQAISESFRDGRSYVSATWHPNLYQECNLEKRGSCWWKLTKEINREKGLQELGKIRSRMFENDKVSDRLSQIYLIFKGCPLEHPCCQPAMVVRPAAITRSISPSGGRTSPTFNITRLLKAFMIRIAKAVISCSGRFWVKSVEGTPQ